jgi:serine/threonine protein kinase
VSDPRRTPDETLPTVFEKGPRATPAHHVEVVEFGPTAMVGKYRIVRHLGSGGMGSVYEAVHGEIGKTVALKVLSRDLAADPRARTRFLREGLAASRLVHPHVVNITDVGSEGDVPFLVMELLRGEDLATCINRQPRGLPIEEAVDVLLAVAAGVFAAHQAGVVHRDLKPRNIFLARNTVKTEVEPKVLDFGISKLDGGSLTGTSLTESGALLGTVPYLSPEHVKGGVTDARSDQYALGVVLFECITGRYPHEGHTSYAVLQNIAEGRFFAPSAFRHDVPAALERALARAMATDPKARFPDVFALGRALLAFASARGQLVWAEYFGRDDRATSVGTATSTAQLALPRPEDEPGPARLSNSTTRSQRVGTRNPAARGAAWLVGLAAVAALGVLGVDQLRLGDRARAFLATSSLAHREITTPPSPPSPPTPAAAPIVAVARQATPTAPAVVAPPASAPLPPTFAPEIEAADVTPPSESTPAKTTRAAARRMVSIDLVSQPTGATVWLDKEVQPRGQTPLKLELLAEGQTHAVILRLRGHTPRVLPLIPSENRTLDVALAPAAPVRLRARGPRTRRVEQRAAIHPSGKSHQEQRPPEDTAQEWSEKLLD